PLRAASTVSAPTVASSTWSSAPTVRVASASKPVATQAVTRPSPRRRNRTTAAGSSRCARVRNVARFSRSAGSGTVRTRWSEVTIGSAGWEQCLCAAPVRALPRCGRLPYARWMRSCLHPLRQVVPFGVGEPAQPLGFDIERRQLGGGGDGGRSTGGGTRGPHLVGDGEIDGAQLLDPHGDIERGVLMPQLAAVLDVQIRQNTAVAQRH